MKSIYSKIEIHPLFYLLLFLSILMARFYDILIFMTVIIVHELGHILVAMLFRWKIQKVIILPFGGMVQFGEKLNRPIYQEFLIVLAGPLFQIILYQFFKTPYHYPLLLFNLLPIYPLDGSKLLFLGSNLLFSYYSSYYIIFISSILAVFFCILFHNLWLFLLALYLLYQSIKMFYQIEEYFLTFLWERYEQSFPYYKTSTIIGKHSKKMKRSVHHIFFYDAQFHDEKEFLKELFHTFL